MILCDIGNSFFHFYKDGRIWKIPAKENPEIERGGEKLYFISVNPQAAKKLLNKFPDAINLDKFTFLDTNYEGIGIDRAAACKAIDDGVIVDAGSAITVDVMQNGMHLGGYILPGIKEYKRAYENISPALNKNFNFDISKELLPQNTVDAISYGAIISIVTIIEKSVKNKRIYFTGGDGPYMARFFSNGIVDNSLVFKGMLKVIKEIK